MWPSLILIACDPSTAPAPAAVAEAAEARTDATAPDAAERVGRPRYFVPEPDERDCAWPMCGGWFVDPPNLAETTCPDGGRSSACYVVEIDASFLQMNDVQRARYNRALGEGRILLEGRLATGLYAGQRLGRFDVVRAWEGATGTLPVGGWAKIEETGMLCLVEPCAHLEETLLNQYTPTFVSELDFGPSGASDEQLGDAWDATLTDGLIVVGRRYIDTGPGGQAPARSVTEFYTQLAP